ncbi:MAG: hypothetical protein ACFB0Z_08450 [Candidatus Phaeomarinobacter sp.]
MQTPTHQNTPLPPHFFGAFIALSVVGVLIWIAGSVFVAPADRPMYHFSEDGAVTALSTVFIAMASALDLVVFFLRFDFCNSGAWFCLVRAAVFEFIAID